MTITAHAYYTHVPERLTEDSDYIPPGTQPGDVLWGDTLDWNTWFEPDNPRSAAIADEHYSEHSHYPDVAACRVEIAIPDDVWAAHKSRGKQDDPLGDYLDQIEWDCAWLHPAVTVIRQNDLSAEHRASAIQRGKREGWLLDGVIE